MSLAIIAAPEGELPFDAIVVRDGLVLARAAQPWANERRPASWRSIIRVPAAGQHPL